MAKTRRTTGVPATALRGRVVLAVAAAMAALVLAVPAAWADDAKAADQPASDPTSAASAPTEQAARASDDAVPKDAKDAKAAAQPEDLPGAYQLPLVRKAPKATMPAPVSFTVSGKKYLEGRSLRTGEFSFHMAAAGAAKVTDGSDLAKQLQQGSGLSDAAKYELVAHGGLTYYPSATQPVPSSSVVANTADGDVTFPTLTFDGTAVGETATRRHGGTVFCYTIAEQPPRNSNGELLDGVTRDPLGRYVYQGVTYDDSTKRVYLYVYQDVDGDGKPVLVLVPLGDATFDAMPGRSASGAGVGFLNLYRGTRLDAYDGAVYLEGQPIAAGEFRFDVRKVAEDGSVLDEQSVACDGTEGGTVGAEVPVIRDHVYDNAGRFFYAVNQMAPEKSAPSDVVLDETSYIITVEVTANQDDDLQAAITYVRKKAPNSDQWVDVNVDAQPTPVVWENRVKADEPDQPTTPDTPTDPDKPSAPDAPGATTPDEGPGSGAGDADGGAGSGGATGTVPGGADDAGDNAGSGDGAAKPDGSAGDKPDADGSAGAKPDADSGHDGAATKPEGTHEGTDGDGSQAAAKPHDATADAGGKGDKSDAKAPGAFAQTGDDLGLPMLIAFLVVIASGVVLAVVSRRRTPRP